MAISNGNSGVREALTPGHFLFTSESVGEGHPGTFLDLYTRPDTWLTRLNATFRQNLRSGL